VPFWTKRNPDYGTKMKTINCRDDSLIEDRGMWTTMKKQKRCIIVAQGFYEWLKKNGGKEKLPHFTKRKDGQLMCFAGLWDCVHFEGMPCQAMKHVIPDIAFGHLLCCTIFLLKGKRFRLRTSVPPFPCLVHMSRPTDSRLDSTEKLYTYTIITTDSNKQLNFLHDRMPVILENGSDAIRTWLDPARTEWSHELQALLKPYQGELECYPVSKDVGKVGNNSPSFLVPINSAENKNNIANFFGTQQKAEEKTASKAERDLEASVNEKGDIKVDHVDETRATTDRMEGTEDNAPLPVPIAPRPQVGDEPKGVKRERDDNADGNTAETEAQNKRTKPTASASSTKSPAKTSTPAKKQGTRSATSNGSAAKTPKADGSRKITSFFGTK
jgi:putative SOS response-associated peptidase YedK